MSKRITQEQAGICFVMLSGSAGVIGLGMVSLGLYMHSEEPLPLSWILLFALPFFLSGTCAWAAWSLFNQSRRTVMLATTAWLFMTLSTVWVILVGNWSPTSFSGVALLGVLEFRIAVYLLQKRHETAMSPPGRSKFRDDA